MNADPVYADLTEGALDFFILVTIGAEPMHLLAIEQRVHQKTRGVFARRPVSFMAAMKRLERAGWVSGDLRQTDDLGLTIVDSVTDSGNEQLDREWAQRRSALAQFVEDGGLEHSFKKFLRR